MGQTVIYLAHHTAAPVCDEALSVMAPFWNELYYNPQEPTSAGKRVKASLDEARESVARLIQAEADDILFTSSGTESNNLAVQGIARAYARRGRHLIVSVLSDLSVINSARALEREGFDVTFLGCDAMGITRPDDLLSAIREDTILFSIPLASGEIGSLQPIADLVSLCHEQGIKVHVDGTPAIGIVPFSVIETPVDALTIHGPTLYGPRGSAALYLAPGTRIRPIMYGGEQEGGWRPGTEILPNWIGFGAAAQWISEQLERWQLEVAPLLQVWNRELEERLGPLGVHRIGPPPGALRLPNHLSYVIEGLDGEAVLIDMEARGVIASAGTACGTKALKRSRAFEAMGISEDLARGYVLFSAPLGITEDDLSRALQIFEDTLRKYR